MARMPWDPEPVSPEDAKIEVEQELPEGTLCRVPDELRSVVVVGRPRVIVLPEICVLTGAPNGIRHTFRLAVAPSRPTPTRVAAYAVASALGLTFDIECTVPQNYFITRNRLKLAAGLLTLLGLIGAVALFVVDLPNNQFATVMIGVVLTLLISGPVIFRHTLHPPFIVGFACDDFVLLEGINPGLTLTLPLRRPIGGRRF